MKTITKKKLRKIVSTILMILVICAAAYLFAERMGWINCAENNPAQQETTNQTNEIDLPVVTSNPESTNHANSSYETNSTFTYEDVPETDGYTPYAIINGNYPYFSEDDKERTDAFEYYSDLDELGRCGVAYANICVELMPTEKRGDIGSVKPSGWVQKKYDKDLVDGGYLWNRCHLIGFQLAGENANKLNLITGSRYMNVTGMLVFEDQVAAYAKDEPGNHVLYRVTPVFVDDELVARGVLIEAYSVEDDGSLCFCVFCYNIQPGIEIDYQTGENWLMEE